MKIILFLTCVFSFALNASVFPQGTRMSIDAKNQSIRQILQEIEAKSDYRFFYNDQLADLDDKVDFKIHKMNEFEAISKLFEGQELTFRLMENNLVLIMPKSIAQQPKTISGIVTGAGGEPLVGVTVIIKGTTNGTITDINGNYSLQVTEDAVLLFSFIGMESQEIPVEDQAQINVIMKEETYGLEQVVVVGYGTQNKANITGAIDVISNEQLQNRQAPNVSQLLVGQVPGLEVGIGLDGYEPGAELSLDIRGIGSLNGGSPYVVIDGFPGDLNRINPEDVETISVLKDAASSAIYGARAPYGVILITTKSGKKNTKLTASYSGQVSIVTPPPLPKMLDSYTFARVMNEAGANRGGHRFSDEVVDRIIAYQNEDWEYLKQFMPEGVTHYETVDYNNQWLADQNSHANNDWIDIHFGNAVNHKHNFSVQGGSERTAYYFSAGYLDQESILNYGDDFFNRFNLSAKVNTAITDWWDFSYEPRFMKSHRTHPNNGRGNDDSPNNPANERAYNIQIHQIYRNYPTSPMYDGWGNRTIASRTVYPEEAGNNNYETTENWHNFATELRPVKGWKINADFAFMSEDRFNTHTDKSVKLYYVDQTYRLVNTPNSVENYHLSKYYYTTNAYTSYELQLAENHNFMIMAGWQYEYSRQRSLNAYKTNMMVEDIPSLQTATGDAVLSENLFHWATQGVFGRFAYNYKERYLIRSNIRYDGTSRFSRGNRWGLFPSVEAGWVVSRENFWEPISQYVNYLKFRGSWGELGNQNVEAYKDLDLIPLRTGQLQWIYGYGSSMPIGYTGTPDLVSPGLTWETATTKNLGLNIAFLRRRLQFDFDWFERTTTDMIGPSEPVPGILGTDVPESNNATLRTRGWESQLRWKQSFSNGLSYFVNLNLYDSKSIVTKYNNPNNLISGWYEGKEVGEIWGYTVNGLFQSEEEIASHADQSFIYGNWRPGDTKYEDINNDRVIDKGEGTLDDPGDLSIIGNSTPRYQYGISAGARYKGFDFSMLWKGTGKRDVYYGGWGGSPYFGFISTGASTIFENHLDYYRDEPGDKYQGLYDGDANINTDAWYPKPYLNTGENRKNTEHENTRYLMNIAYLRLQNVQLGYTLPVSISSRLRLTNLRVFFSGENLLTIKAKRTPDYIDPVAFAGYNDTLGKTYGAERIYSFGVTVTY